MSSHMYILDEYRCNVICIADIADIADRLRYKLRVAQVTFNIAYQ